MHLFGHLLHQHYDIVACGKCGFVFNDFSAKQDDFSKYYESLSKYETNGISGAGGLSVIDRKRFEKIINFILPYIKNNKNSILDIGCSQGGLLFLFKEKGYTELFGIDPSKYCVEVVKKNQINAEVGNIFNIKIRKKYDIVILSAVLEHIVELDKLIMQLKKTLKKGGSLLIEVPDAGRYRDYNLSAYYRFDLEHINHFSIHHLSNLFCRSGFTLIDSAQIEVPVSKYHLSPSILCLFKNSGIFNDVIPDFTLKNNIIEYIKISEDKDEYLDIETLIKSQKPVYIWGLGAHTYRLLKQKRLSLCNIIAFIDNDPKKEGKTLLNKPVYSSDYILNNSNDGSIVVISSVLYEKEMSEYLKKNKYSGHILSII